jgi:hypothetical protein
MNIYQYPDNILLSEIEQVAADECQQDWNDHRFAAIYREAFIDGAKWVLTRTKTNSLNKSLESS